MVDSVDIIDMFGGVLPLGMMNKMEDWVEKWVLGLIKRTVLDLAEESWELEWCIEQMVEVLDVGLEVVEKENDEVEELGDNLVEVLDDNLVEEYGNLVCRNEACMMV